MGLTKNNNNGNCRIKQTKHNYWGTLIYKVWAGMKQRCFNKNSHKYKNYGGRGITMCEEWVNSPAFFCDWALSNGWEKGLQIDRIDNDGDYEPSNCRFVTLAKNIQNNSRTKLSLEKVKEIRDVYSKINITKAKMAEIYGVSPTHMGDILNYKKWKN